MLGPDAIDDLPARVQLVAVPAAAERHRLDLDAEARAVGSDLALKQIHRRRTDEFCDKEIGRTIVDFERSADLLDMAVAQDDDLVGDGHSLDLVMRDIDRRASSAAHAVP